MRLQTVGSLLCGVVLLGLGGCCFSDMTVHTRTWLQQGVVVVEVITSADFVGQLVASSMLEDSPVTFEVNGVTREVASQKTTFVFPLAELTPGGKTWEVKVSQVGITGSKEVHFLVPDEVPEVFWGVMWCKSVFEDDDDRVALSGNLARDTEYCEVKDGKIEVLTIHSKGAAVTISGEELDRVPPDPYMPTHERLDVETMLRGLPLEKLVESDDKMEVDVEVGIKKGKKSVKDTIKITSREKFLSKFTGEMLTGLEKRKGLAFASAPKQGEPVSMVVMNDKGAERRLMGASGTLAELDAVAIVQKLERRAGGECGPYEGHGVVERYLVDESAVITRVHDGKVVASKKFVATESPCPATFESKVKRLYDTIERSKIDAWLEGQIKTSVAPGE